MSDATDALTEKAYAAAFTCEPPSGQKWAYVKFDDLRALALDAYDLAQADLAAAQAVIEQAPHAQGCPAARKRAYAWQSEQCNCWKSQSSSSALAAHDAEVAAKALDKAADETEREAPGEPTAGATFLAHADYLRGRAQALRDGQETT